MTFFKINPEQAENQYTLVKGIAGPEFVEMTQKEHILSRKSNLDFLTDEGKGELEFILMYLNKKVNIKTCFYLAHMISILFVFLKPGEVYCLIDKLHQGSKLKVEKG